MGPAAALHVSLGEPLRGGGEDTVGVDAFIQLARTGTGVGRPVGAGPVRAGSQGLLDGGGLLVGDLAGLPGKSQEKRYSSRL